MTFSEGTTVSASWFLLLSHIPTGAPNALSTTTDEENQYNDSSEPSDE